MADLDRSEIVKALREFGHHEKADKAEKELPKKVSTEQHQDVLAKLGIDDSLLGKLPGGIGDKLKGIL